MILEDVIVSPAVTEKAISKNEQGQYVFFVKPGATKIDVKQAFDQIYGRKVSLVNISTLPEKTRRTKTGEAPKRKPKKKAYVTFLDSSPFDFSEPKK